MKKIFLVFVVALAVLAPHKASAYYRGGYGGGGCCYGGGGYRGGFGVGIDLYAPAYPPVYGGYAYPAPYYYPPPGVVYADPGYAAPPPGYAPPPAAAAPPVYADAAPAGAPGQECREYRGPIVIGGKTEQGYGTACRQADGTWHMVSSQPQ